MRQPAENSSSKANLGQLVILDAPKETSAPRGSVGSVSPGIRHELSKTDAQKNAPPSPILVVDDDTSILNIVGDILESEGYQVEKAANGAEALVQVERVRPAVILLDMRMPVMDGWTFAKVLKERQIRIPILVMTAAQNAGRWADEIGADGYLAKPFDLLDLLHSVERYYSS